MTTDDFGLAERVIQHADAVTQRGSLMLSGTVFLGGLCLLSVAAMLSRLARGDVWGAVWSAIPVGLFGQRSLSAARARQARADLAEKAGQAARAAVATPVGWYLDPRSPHLWRHWSGSTWDRDSAQPRAFRMACPAEVLRAATVDARRCWLGWLVLAHVAAAVIVAVYLGTARLNTAVFHYGFSQTVPSGGASVALGLSLVLNGLFALTVGVIAYGCLSLLPGNTGPIDALRESCVAARRAWSHALPLFALTIGALLVVLPGVGAVMLYGVVPLRDLGIAPAALPARSWARAQSRALLVVGGMAAAMGIVFWVAVIAMARTSTTSRPTAWVIGWVTFVVLVLLSGWCAAGLRYVALNTIAVPPPA